MSLPCRYPLPYTTDSSALFARLRGRRGAVFLDSGKPGSEGGRYDIISADPDEVFSYKSVDYGDYVTLLKNISTELQAALAGLSGLPDLPFSGGAIGYLSYDAGEAAMLAQPPQAETPLPIIHIGIYHWAVIVDHQLQRCELVAQPSLNKAAVATLQRLLGEPVAQPGDFRLSQPFTSTMDRPRYQAAFARTQDPGRRLLPDQSQPTVPGAISRRALGRLP